MTACDYTVFVEALPKGQSIGISQVDVYKNAKKSHLVILNGLKVQFFKQMNKY